MRARAWNFIGLAAVAALGLDGCQDAPHPLSPTPMPSRTAAVPVPLAPRIIAPQTTDPAIDWVPAVNPQFNYHYVWLDAAQESNGKLLVFLPGSNGKPRGYQLLEQEAARLGYHVIGLMYQNSVAVVDVCTGSPDPNCSGNMRLEIIDGVDRSSFVDVSPANSIDNRLTKLLLYLDAQYPNEQWSRFLKHGAPKWSQIAVGGHSQGAGQAALIGKIHHVNRVIMFGGPVDARVAGEADAWVSIGKTPAARYFALFHSRDHFAAGIRPNLTALDLDRFGDPVVLEASEPPYGGTHILVTDLEPQGGYAIPNPHLSEAVDRWTPLGPDGTPLLSDAWRYLLGGRGGLENADADEAVLGSEWSEPVHLGPPINTPSADQSPALSPDGLSLYFASNRPGGLGGNDLWVSHRASHHSPWEAPANLGPSINTSGIESGPNLSPDGHLLFFQSNRPGGNGSNDIYVSRRADTDDDFGWGPPVNLGPDVNTAAAEVAPWYAEHDADGPTLYFARGPSNLFTDIYSAPITRDGHTRGPATLVSELSTPDFSDSRMTVRADGREIVFFSDRPGGLGGTDLWSATRRSVHDAWSRPINLGAPLNSPDQDLLPFLSRDGRTLFFTSTRPGGLGDFDIWMSTRPAPEEASDDRDDGDAGERHHRHQDRSR